MDGLVDDVLWGLPFLGMLGSIAVLPALVPRLWHRRMDAVAGFWCACLLLPWALRRGAGSAAALAGHALWHDYLPLMCLLAALYVAGGGLRLGGPFGTPGGNTALLAAGTLLAGVLGTTGASMLLIQPLLRANAHRTRRAHLVVLLILLAGNAGGGLLPLGPPLYVGYLQGVGFWWPLRHMAGPVAVVALPLLAAGFVYDRHAARGEAAAARRPFTLQGGWNLVPVGLAVASVALSRGWGMALCLGAAGLSLAITPAALRSANGFRWGPLHEVAVLFAGLFVTIAPVLEMLDQGQGGPLAPLFALTRDAAGQPVPLVYFWLSGIMSGFLDNAPTYLMFLREAGGLRAAPPVLLAISAGSVLFGGLSYIGNAPNMMIRAIAVHEGVRMPGFGGYVALAGSLLVLPFLAIGAMFLR